MAWSWMTVALPWMTTDDHGGDHCVAMGYHSIAMDVHGHHITMDDRDIATDKPWMTMAFPWVTTDDHGTAMNDRVIAMDDRGIAMDDNR